MNQTRIGVIGLGRMGKNHCRVLSTLRTAELIGVFDIDPEVGLSIAREYQSSFHNNLESLLLNVDAVSVATPTHTHFEIVKQALDHGVHVFVEKPLAENVATAEQLCEVAAESPLVVQVGHIERFNPAYRELKNLLEHMQVLAIDFRRLSPFQGSNVDVDVVFDLMVHDTDLILNLVGEEPDEVNVYGISALSGVIDHVVALLFYPNGPLVSMTASRVTEEKIRRIEVTTLEAYIEADLLNKSLSANRRTVGEYLDNNRDGVKYRQESLVERIHVPGFEPLQLELSHFIDCVQGKGDCLVPACDGLRALQMVEQIQQKATERLITMPMELRSRQTIQERMPTHG